MNRKFYKIENNNLKIDRKKKIAEGKGKDKNRIRDRIFISIFFVIFLSLLFQISNIVLAQDNNRWFAVTFTSYSSNKVGIKEYGIYVPLKDVVYYLQENLS